MTRLSSWHSPSLLHRRGWRQATAKAPLRETLAAALLAASGWDGSAPLVDPLCGTLNFAARTPLVAVNVALRTPTGVTAAAVIDPFAEEVYWMVDGQAGLRRDGAAASIRWGT